MNGRINILSLFSLLLMSSIQHDVAYGEEPHQTRRPNIVVLIADDLGIGDLGCFGNDTIKTPNIDKLAAEGVILRHHLAAAALCTPSRAALLTGRYPARYGLVGEPGTPPVVVHVASKVGLPESEITLGEAFTAANYTTGFVGKWHLGSSCGWFGAHCIGPLRHGFHHFFGMLFTLTKDMGEDPSFWIFNFNDRVYQALFFTSLVALISTIYLKRKKFHRWALALLIFTLLSCPTMWFIYTHYRIYTQYWWRISPWMEKYMNGIVTRNGESIHQSVPFDSVFEELVNESVSFIHAKAKEEKPFLLVHSFLHVHTPMSVAEHRSGRSAHGRYGDNVEEMDAGVGFILDALKEENLDTETIVYFVSDHGGHLEEIDPPDGQRSGGHNQKFKGGKGMGAVEGAIRVPGIIRWNSVIPPGSSLDTPTSLLDILPTFLQLAGLPTLQELTDEAKDLDGISFAPLLTNRGSSEKSTRILIHHCLSAIQALRLITETKIYKMYLFLQRWEPNSTQCGWGENILCGCFGEAVEDVTNSPVLYELNSDPYEDNPIDSTTQEYKDVVRELKAFLRDWKKRVPYPPSQYNSVFDTILSPWLQPFKYLR